MTDGAVVVTTTVYVIVGNQHRRTRTAYTLTEPTTATVTVTDYEGDTVVRTFTVTKRPKLELWKLLCLHQRTL